MPDVEKVIEGLEMSYKYSNVDENNTLVPQWIVLHAIALLKEYERAIKHQSDHLDALLKAQEQRHRLEVHNIGNVDIPENVTEKQFHAVMNNVVAALEHTDKGESWPYDEEGR